MESFIALCTELTKMRWCGSWQIFDVLTLSKTVSH